MNEQCLPGLSVNFALYAPLTLHSALGMSFSQYSKCAEALWRCRDRMTRSVGDKAGFGNLNDNVL